ncbi:phage major capsid protein [Bradyrhizobium diazoefficiens]|nr:phage major capsid protein [Bradyrhizobium diazoefficiens]MBR0778547.1 phage major capsid protein [Bradyrhizobium diazoefficiens]
MSGQALPNADWSNLQRDLAAARAILEKQDDETTRSLTEIKAELRTARDEQQKAIDELYKKFGRPFGAHNDNDPDSIIRKDAIALNFVRHGESHPKFDPHSYVPTKEDITDGENAIKAWRPFLRHGNLDRLTDVERKSLSAFSFAGAAGSFFLPPTLSDRILSCVYENDGNVASLVDNVAISTSSIKYMVDNVVLEAVWVCSEECNPATPQQDMTAGLGELEIAAEALMLTTCGTRDFLEDSAVNVEQWLARKAQRAFRRAIANAIIAGSGLGQPSGLLSPQSGVRICDTGDSTPAGQISWQDCFMLMAQLPAELWDGAVFMANQQTIALLFTMSDATGKPIFSASMVENRPQMRLFGWPLVLNNMIPSVAPGAVCLIAANLKEAYTLVTRRGVSLRVNPYRSKRCIDFDFDARVGGSVTCPSGAVGLRVN